MNIRSVECVPRMDGIFAKKKNGAAALKHHLSQMPHPTLLLMRSLAEPGKDEHGSVCLFPDSLGIVRLVRRAQQWSKHAWLSEKEQWPALGMMELLKRSIVAWGGGTWCFSRYSGVSKDDSGNAWLLSASLGAVWK